MTTGDPRDEARQRSRRRRLTGEKVQEAIARRVRDIAHNVEERAAASVRRRVRLPVAIARLLVYSIGRFFRDRCPQQASSLSFQTVISVVPLLAVAISALRAAGAMDAESTLVDFIAERIVPISRADIADKLHQFSENVTFESLGLLGLAGTIIIAFTMINSLESIINIIWRAPRRRPLAKKFLVFYATATLGPFLLGVSLYQAARFGLTAGWAGFAFSFLSTMGGFFMLNFFLPVPRVQARAAFVGSAAATLLFELAKHGFSVYVTGFAFERYSGIYGALAVLPLWLVWIYYCWLVVLFGALLTHAVQHAHLIERLGGRSQRPDEDDASRARTSS